MAANIIRLAIPLSLALAVNGLYSLVDRIYIGHMGEDSALALTGIGLVFPITTVVSAFAGLFGHGGGPLFAIARGEGNTEEAKKVMGNSFSLLCISGVIVAVLCMLLKEPILMTFGASPDTYPFANDYITIYLLGTVFVMISTGMNGYINAQGFGTIGMITVMLGAIVNIILDPIFIFVFDMGVKGAAVATVIAQFCSALWIILFLTGKKALIKLEKGYLRPTLKRTLSIMSLGTSTFVMSFTTCAVSIVNNRVLKIYGGDMYIGAMTVITSVRDVLMMLIMGLTQAAQPVISYNYGAKLYKRVKSGITFITLTSLAYGIAICAITEFFPYALATLFSDDLSLVDITVPAMRIDFIGFAFMALQFSGQTTFLALKKSKQAVFFSLLRKAFIIIPLTIILPRFFGTNGVFLAEPISEVVGGIACYTTMLLTVNREFSKAKFREPRCEAGE